MLLNPPRLFVKIYVFSPLFLTTTHCWRDLLLLFTDLGWYLRCWTFHTNALRWSGMGDVLVRLMLSHRGVSFPKEPSLPSHSLPWVSPWLRYDWAALLAKERPREGSSIQCMEGATVKYCGYDRRRYEWMWWMKTEVDLPNREWSLLADSPSPVGRSGLV